jgi:hypothetical protein
MPQSKKTTARHRLLGNYRPSRHKQRQADADGIGEPPAHLDSQQRAIWGELEASLPYGVGSRADRVAFELATILVARMRSAKLSAAESTLLFNVLDKFALTPLGRQRLDPEPQPPDQDKLTGLASFRKPNALDKYR